ncbi:MAG: lipocalin family protein [Candidatus Limnocylindrales bacterium]
MSRRSPHRAWAAGLAILAGVLAACGGPVFANPPVARPEVTPAPASTARAPDPRPVVLPADDAPHDRLTEWWYYTGHLRDQAGGRWGFEFVIFRAERGAFPVTWASHLALTDETGDRFHYAQRAEIGPQVNAASAGTGTTAGATGFALGVRGLDLSDPSTFTRAPWAMTGADGADRLEAAAGETETQGDPSRGFGLALDLAAARPAVLHDRDGYVDFGPAGGSYYVSRMAMTADGTITVGDRILAVDGTAWFDHQWGDFIAVGAGGWDWFAVNLDDGTDLTLSLVRAADGSYPLAYGTLVDAEGGTRHLDGTDFWVEVTGDWNSPTTGATWPAGWTVTLPGEDLVIRLQPSVPQQELDTRTTTGVVYWEGSQRVSATRAGRALGGEAYVELTGYAAGR